MYKALMVYIDNFDGRDVAVNKTISRNRDIYTVGVSPVTIPTTIGFSRPLSEREKRDVLMWLCPDDKFHELIIEETNLSYYIMFTKVKYYEYDNGSRFDCEMETLDGYSYTQPYEYSKIVTKQDKIIIDNYSNIATYYYPNIKINFLSDCKVTITNENLGISSIITGVTNEIVNINNTKEIVVSNKKLYKYLDVDGYLRLKYGVNDLKIQGHCRIDITCKYPMLME